MTTRIAVGSSFDHISFIGKAVHNGLCLTCVYVTCGIGTLRLL